MNLLDLFAIARTRDPGAPALQWVDGERETEWSYGELWDEVEVLASGLAHQGLRPGDRVACYLGNRPEFVLIYLAILRAGAVMLPMNLAYRRRELEHLLSDAQPRFLVTEECQLPILAELADSDLAGLKELLVVERLESLRGAPRPPESAPSGDDLALLMYTSGTTGASKGARITHGNVVATVTALLAAWDWSPSDRLLLTLPLFHTHGLVVGLTTALAAGATVRLHRKFETEAVWADLLSGEVDLFFGVPTLYQRLLDRAGTSPVPFDLSHLRLLCSGSAPLPAETHQSIEELTGQTILERYGMTETGMNLSNPYAGARIPGTVGKPLPGVSARIVDAEDREVPAGDQGELQVRGPNVFEGYWNAPEKTAASFVIDATGHRWFRTGDLACVDPTTGYFTLLGRSRELIISGGYNIYPREIEEVLCTYPGIRAAAVVGRPSTEWGEVPVAFIVSDRSLATDDLVAFCRSQIAAFKVPKEVRVIEALPTNALGKVQKHLLPT